MGPERCWTKLEQDEVRRNSDGGPKRFWRANQSSDLSLGAKDQSKHLVAGLHWNFPQDSRDRWNQAARLVENQFHLVKRMIRSIGYYPTQLILKLWIGDYSSISERNACRRRSNAASRLNETVSSGPLLVSRTGDVGWTKRRVKMHKCRLMKIPKKALIFRDSRKVVMEVEILSVTCNNEPA